MNVITELDDLYSFFSENQDLFNKRKNRPGGNSYGDQLKVLKDVFDISFPYGYCFPLSQFVFYYLGGYDSEFDLRCIRDIELPVEGYDFKTTHWFVQSKDKQIVIDLSKSQFDKIVDIEEYYSKARRANFGAKFITIDSERIRFNRFVPSIQTRNLYKAYRENFSPLPISNVLEFSYLLEQGKVNVDTPRESVMQVEL